ncbi:unnamed protein product [Vicia faba]|uniref:Uncharacterized protein n=1 Tax=Vicia faba TaxID=3906 RepID=A0AAV0ZJH5_VICFA|nr:unnamed protein product [Vicia faba]
MCHVTSSSNPTSESEYDASNSHNIGQMLENFIHQVIVPRESVLKEFSSQLVVTSTQEIMASKQEEMDVQMKIVPARKDEMGFDLKVILEIRKHKP